MNLMFKFKVLGFVLAFLFGGAVQILFSFIPGKKFEAGILDQTTLTSREVSHDV